MKVSLDFLSSHSKEMVSLFIPFLGAAISMYMQNRPRLVRSVRHGFTFLINEPVLGADGEVLSKTQTVNTASVSILNSGRSPAKTVEITFNWKPQYFNIWPSRTYEEKVSPDGRCSIILDSLAPKETFGFELLSINRPLPEIINVRSETTIATKMELQLQPVPKKSVIAILSILIAIGAFSVVYVIASVVEPYIP